MDHAQFEMQVAAILAAGVAGASGITEPAAVVELLGKIHEQLTARGTVIKQSTNFIPKGR